MVEGHVVLIHGLWSSPTTWDRLEQVLRADADLSGIQWARYGYPSPKLGIPFLPRRIPDHDDIAQALDSFVQARVPDDGPWAVVTHSQGGLILQRYLAWKVNDGRGRDLARIRSIVMLACPHEGSDYLRLFRNVAGFGFRPQTESLQQFRTDVAASKRTVLNQITNATAVSDRTCPIPVHVYAGDSDNVVRRVSAQATFPDAGVLPGDHSSILDPAWPGSVTAETIRRHLVTDFSAPAPSAPVPPPVEQSTITIADSSGFQIGNSNTQINRIDR
ncbi:triacylglycerol lipase [Micromonospora sp. U21]|uniref:esterase/lipase family protein n=1 Tax=Micromonospora sp. U21 TaxID=2824899 RepID=UPI001B38429C|nr:alpha/beta fold hydrolase [Micromonospora sp. U21]MBQ0905017.1 alpha/beta fold hydrolase [Micromonospora sp. U21]